MKNKTSKIERRFPCMHIKTVPLKATKSNLYLNVCHTLAILIKLPNFSNWHAWDTNIPLLVIEVKIFQNLSYSGLRSLSQVKPSWSSKSQTDFHNYWCHQSGYLMTLSYTIRVFQVAKPNRITVIKRGLISSMTTRWSRLSMIVCLNLQLPPPYSAVTNSITYRYSISFVKQRSSRLSNGFSKEIYSIKLNSRTRGWWVQHKRLFKSSLESWWNWLAVKYHCIGIHQLWQGVENHKWCRLVSKTTFWINCQAWHWIVYHLDEFNFEIWRNLLLSTRKPQVFSRSQPIPSSGTHQDSCAPYPPTHKIKTMLVPTLVTTWMVHSTYKTLIFLPMHHKVANNGFLLIKGSWCLVPTPNSIMKVRLWTTQVPWSSMMTSRKWVNFQFNKMKHRLITNNLHINNQNENQKLKHESRQQQKHK